MQAVEKVQPNQIGTRDFTRISRLLRAAEYSLLMYRNTPNTPYMQREKSGWWREYQESLSELQEALNA